MSTNPLLQPFRLGHLTLRNRIMTTSHEPAYSEDGMPTARYRAYHAERAKAGVALAMTVGSAILTRVVATYCLDRIYQRGVAPCIHSAATGQELTMPHDIHPAADCHRGQSWPCGHGAGGRRRSR